jgi:hypothetical protein
MLAMPQRRVCLPAVVACILLSFSASRSRAQSGAPAPHPAPVIRTSANLVLVDVVVTAHGQAVEGLSRRDFHVFEDGKEQAIISFEEYRASDAPMVAAAPTLPPHVYSNDPRFDLSSAANVLLLDALNTPLTDRQFVRCQMIQYPNGIAPGLASPSSRWRRDCA